MHASIPIGNPVGIFLGCSAYIDVAWVGAIRYESKSEKRAFGHIAIKLLKQEDTPIRVGEKEG